MSKESRTDEPQRRADAVRNREAILDAAFEVGHEQRMKNETGQDEGKHHHRSGKAHQP